MSENDPTADLRNFISLDKGESLGIHKRQIAFVDTKEAWHRTVAAIERDIVRLEKDPKFHPKKSKNEKKAMVLASKKEIKKLLLQVIKDLNL